jgi:pyruvate-ferredoxin/flavodoxin oxidoreductase
MIDEDRIREHRLRALTPDRPVLRGTAQNPDVYFQARETVNPYYLRCPAIVSSRRWTGSPQLTGRRYRLFDYVGRPGRRARRRDDGVRLRGGPRDGRLLAARGEKVGLVKVRLYRPFDNAAFLAAFPAPPSEIDRRAGPLQGTGRGGEPLYLDVVHALFERGRAGRPLPAVVGGRYGLSSKEFTPAMVKAVFDNLCRRSRRTTSPSASSMTSPMTQPRRGPGPSPPKPTTCGGRCSSGLGADGTVGANKESIKIIGENTENYAQAYFVYDSKKSGAITISHLRFGKQPIRSTYLISQAQFVACHQPSRSSTATSWRSRKRAAPSC